MNEIISISLAIWSVLGAILAVIFLSFAESNEFNSRKTITAWKFLMLSPIFGPLIVSITSIICLFIYVLIPLKNKAAKFIVD